MYTTRDIFDHTAPSRPRVIDEAITEEVVIETVAEPSLSSRSLGQMFDISEESIRGIRHEAGFEFAKPFIAPPLTNGHKQARISFAQRLLTNNFDLSRIVFSDEATILIDTMRRKIWRVPGWRTETTTSYQANHPIQRVIWAAIGLNWKSPIIYINGNINSQSYIQQLLNNEIIMSLNNHYGSNYYLQQDGARPHTSHYTLGWLQAMDVPILECWPPHSPDLSPIEHCWGIIKDRINMRNIQTIEDLDEAIKNAWNSIDMITIENLVSSFKGRLQVCIENNGASLNGKWKRVHALHHSS
jgi:hypothetical protein